MSGPTLPHPITFWTLAFDIISLSPQSHAHPLHHQQARSLPILPVLLLVLLDCFIFFESLESGAVHPRCNGQLPSTVLPHNGLNVSFLTISSSVTFPSKSFGNLFPPIAPCLDESVQVRILIHPLFLIKQHLLMTRLLRHQYCHLTAPAAGTLVWVFLDHSS